MTDDHIERMKAMTDEQVVAMWQQMAVEIGDGVFRTINSPATVNTDHENGYVLLFFSSQGHNGRATMVSSTTNKEELRLLLTTTLRALDRAEVVYQGRSN